jgi:hypothetical protein
MRDRTPEGGAHQEEYTRQDEQAHDGKLSVLTRENVRPEAVSVKKKYRKE